MKDSIKYLAYILFFTMQCYKEEQRIYDKAFTVISIFEDEQEHTKFIEYVKGHREDFKQDVENQNVDEIFPEYSRDVNTAIFYKLGKTLVQWLDRWRQC